MLTVAVPLLVALHAEAAPLVDIAVQPYGVAGKNPPSLTLTALQALTGLELELIPSRGEPIRAKLGELAAGVSHRIELNAPIGQSQWQGTLTATPQTGESTVTTFAFAATARAQLEIEIPDERVFLFEHRLELRLSRAAARCDYAVTYDGAAADRGTVHFNGEPAGTWLTVPWRPTTEEAVVLRLRLSCRDQDDNEATLELFPWWLEIPHEDVSFALGSAAISTSERPKLDKAFREIDEAVARYGKMLDLRLYVAGHTDTVGDAQHNLRLSHERARSLAVAFRQLGVNIPLWYAGFGEQHLVIPTTDDVDEPRNRRARYILAVNDPEEGPWQEL